MNEEWRPNAPNLKEDFEAATTTASERTEERTDRARPVSRIELEALEEQRDKPEVVRDYTIGGTVEKIVHQRHHQEREERIALIKERLARMKGRARDDFERSR